jgi:leucyl-tRNA synthetase
VVRPADEHGPEGASPEAFTSVGISVHSEVIEGLPTPEAKKTIATWLEERGLGKGTVNYRLRDWLFSRQRYWGEPFPIVYDETEMPVAVEESELPVELPEVDDYAPEITDDPNAPPRPPLARAKEWVTFSREGKTYHRELNTMPNWAGSCWYYLRYLDPHNSEKLVDPQTERYWSLTQKEGAQRPESYDPQTCKLGGVDLYVGGAEHAVLHLLYARFWHKALHDLGVVSTPEPFQRLFNQGYVQAAAYTDERGVYVEATEVEERDGQYFHQGKPVNREFGKMGKSLRNAISPDEITQEYGADTLRLYEMFMGPLEMSKSWNTRDIIGVHRFLQRVWRNLVDEQTGELCLVDEDPDDELARIVHKTIDSVRRDMETLGFNTAIARLQELNNALTAVDRVPRSVAEVLIRMLAPLAPHIAEELWSKLGHEKTIVYEPFPLADPKVLVEDQIEIPVMVAGKVRAKIQVAPGTLQTGLEEAAMAHPKMQEFLAGKKVVKVIAVVDRMVNIVVK